MQSFIVNPSPDQKLKRESRICLPPHPTLSLVFRRPQKPSRNRVKRITMENIMQKRYWNVLTIDNATYIRTGLNNFNFCKTKLTSSLLRVNPCTLCTVQTNESFNRNWVCWWMEHDEYAFFLGKSKNQFPWLEPS